MIQSVLEKYKAVKAEREGRRSVDRRLHTHTHLTDGENVRSRAYDV